MSNLTIDTSSAAKLAKKMEMDIHRRGLRSGDRYLTTVEAGHMFGVSVTTAHRAMKLLADEELIVRRNKAGTFVGPNAGTEHESLIQTVYLLVPWQKKEYFYGYLEPIVRGLHQSLPGANVQFSIIPQDHAVEYVEELISVAQSSGGATGIMAASCTDQVYHVLAESGVPTVVLGTLHPTGPKLPWIDLDNWQAGRLMAQYLIDRGHQRIALLAMTMDRGGDKLLYDGINETLTTAGLPPNSLAFHVLSEDPGPLRTGVQHLMEQPNRPTGLMTRVKRLAELGGMAVTDMGLRVPEDVEIIFVDHTTEQLQSATHPHVRTKLSRQENAAMVGEMLKRLSEGKPLDNEWVVIPVELCERQ